MNDFTGVKTRGERKKKHRKNVAFQQHTGCTTQKIK